MQTIAIFGAAGTLGLAMAEYFHQQGFTVIAVAREPAKNPGLSELGIETIACDAVDQAQIKAAIDSLPSDACVISTMGSFKDENPVDYIGHRYLINALEQKNIRRFLLVTSIGCGDSWSTLSERSKAAFGNAVREKSLAESWLQTSDLAFTILRPGGLMNGAATENAILSQNNEVHGLINRSDVAVLTLQLLKNDDSIRQIYACVDPTLTR